MHQVNGPGHQRASGPGGPRRSLTSSPSFNAEETRAAGTHPSEASSVFKFLAARLSPDGGALELEFVARAGRDYTLQAAPLGTNNAWSAAGQVSAEVADRTVTLALPWVGQPTRMYRLVTPAQPR
jgi:hypothetical protein